MLSRVAHCLYWMSRYLERAEHTARLLDVNLREMLDQTPAAAAQRWKELLTSLRRPALADGWDDSYRITEALTFDLTNNGSIRFCITAARDNARQVREQISSEMWEQLNGLFLTVNRATMEEVWQSTPHDFFKTVKQGAHLFQGITDATMSHGEGWQFIQVGRYVERAAATAALLAVHLPLFWEAQRSGASMDDLEWVGLLKSCTAFEAYCKVYTATMNPERITEFLLLSPEFPRSVRFVAGMLQNSLQAIARATGSRGASRADRLAGRLRAALDYAQVDEIMADDIHEYLTNIQALCTQIHSALYQTYILQQDISGKRRWLDDDPTQQPGSLDDESAFVGVGPGAGETEHDPNRVRAAPLQQQQEQER